MNVYKENYETLFAGSHLIWDLANSESLNYIVHCVLCAMEYWCPPIGLCHLITQKITLCICSAVRTSHLILIFLICFINSLLFIFVLLNVELLNT